MTQLLEKAFAELNTLSPREQDELAARILTNIDVTSRRDSASDERLSLLVEQSPLAIIEWTLDFTIIGWNPAAESIFGYSRDEALGQPGDLLIIAPDAREHVATLWQTLKTGKLPQRSINNNVTKDGRTITCEWHNVPLLDKKGNVLSVAAFAQDITERIQAEEALSKSRQRLALVLLQSPLAIIERDLNFIVLDWNPAAEQIFGYTREEAVGKSGVDLLVPDEVKDTVNNILGQLLTQNGVVRSINENVTKDGRRITCEWYNVPLVDAEGNKIGLASMAMDITDRIRAEREIQMAKEAAETANLAKSTFLANMSHELRTPLNAILGFAQVMERDPDLSPRQQEYVDIISRSGEHLLGLINDVLEISKIEAGRLKLQEAPFDLYQMLEGIEEMLKIRAEGKGLQLLFELDPSVPHYALGDENKLRQILLNLVGNAIKFTREGGIALRAKYEMKGEPRLLVEIEDTGEGIAEHELATLFQPFVQAEGGAKSHEGTGLGLAISRQFVHLMGGEISVRSIIGQGTVFLFDVHIQVAKSEDIQTRRAERRVIGIDPIDQGKYRILVVDDKWENRRLLVEWLKQVGFEVRAAADGREALAIWEQWSPQLIWMDIRMPGMDGYEATRIIKSSLKGQSTVIIALTASILDQDQAGIRAVGCDDFVRKPVRASIIFGKIVEHLGVHFVYEEPKAEVASIDSLVDSPILIDALTDLPIDWVTDLRHAAEEINISAAKTVIIQIRTQDPILADVLDDLVDNYRFDQLQTLIQKAERA